MRRIEVIDSHTEGEPTRVVVAGAPDLGFGTAGERLERFRSEHDAFRSAVIREPRGHAAMVGALLLEPRDPEAVAQVLYFNNVGYLRMCVHGTLGVARTLAHIGWIGPGRHRLETPAGDVAIHLDPDGRARVANVESRRHAKDVELEIPGHGPVRGDVAWGGNWFFLVHEHDQELSFERIEELTRFSKLVRRVLEARGITGEGGEEIDHIELFGPPDRADADSKNFVLCPGGEYDRSPCGTGTSAKIACLAADGRLAEGEVWRQESIIGSLFEGRFERGAVGVVPTIGGGVWLTGETRLLVEEGDPFARGIGP